MKESLVFGSWVQFLARSEFFFHLPLLKLLFAHSGLETSSGEAVSLRRRERKYEHALAAAVEQQDERNFMKESLVFGSTSTFSGAFFETWPRNISLLVMPFFMRL